MNMIMCWMEIKDGAPHAIHKSRKCAPEDAVAIPYSQAVYIIRALVYNRAKRECERCAKRLTWEQMHMDEKVSRGEGGIISLDNCWCLCADCHILRPESEHGERRWGGKAEEV